MLLFTGIKNSNQGVMHENCEIENDKRASWGRTLNAVALGYSKVCSLPVLTGVQYHPDEPPNHVCGPDSIHFKADVERLLDEKLGNDEELFKSWIQLVEGENLKSSVMLRLAIRLGPQLERRGLHPTKYFRTIKKGRADRRPLNGAS